jgi:hypothetical protein
MPTSADDLDDSIVQEQTGDTHDPLSLEEYSLSVKCRRSRLRDTADHTPTHGRSTTKDNVSHAPSFENTDHAATMLSRLEWPQTAAADQSHDNAAETEEDLVKRPRKKPRTVLFEIPIWTQPELSRSPIPKTSWDRHWSRKHNPKARTFDEHGNKITTWREIQERQRREQGMRPRPRRGKDSVKPKSKENQSTGLTTEVEAEVKLEHTCLSDEVASICPACAKEEESRCDALLDDDRIIDPSVARRLLPEHTCLSDTVTGPCVACARENETQGEDEHDLAGSTKQARESKRRLSCGFEGLNRERTTHTPGFDPVDQHGGPLNSADAPPDFRDDTDEEPEEYDWENNSDIPKPQYITRIIKYYSKRKPFTPEEDRLIIQMYEEQCKTWDDIMEAIRQRSRGQLQYHYYTALRSKNWKEKRAAAADAIKQQKRSEVERTRRQKAAEASVRSFSGSLFEKPKKKAMVRCRKPTRKEEEVSEWDEWRRTREPLDPAFLTPLEDGCQSPDFFPAVPPALGLSASGHGNSQTPSDASQVPARLYTEPVASQIEGVPMEPATQLSRPYEWLYPKIYPCPQNYQNSNHSTLDHGSEVDSSGDETLLEYNDRRGKDVSQESPSVGISHPSAVNSQRDKRYSMEEEVIRVPSGLPVFMPSTTKEANVLAIARSAPAGHIPSSRSAPQKSLYETDGSLEEIDLI